MSFNGQDLFNLLPAYYRQKDTQLALAANLLTAQEAASLKTLLTNQASLDPASQAQLAALQAKAAMGPLQSLLMLIAEQVAAVEEDLNQLYDDEFIETCAPWVIPYIGDLIGYQPVHGVAAAVASPRAEVAHTISFRRRKGTILVIEQLDRDVTGWGAHASGLTTITRRICAVGNPARTRTPDSMPRRTLRRSGGLRPSGAGTTCPTSASFSGPPTPTR